MFVQDNNKPERSASPGLPIGLLLLSVGALLAYLTIGGAWSENSTETVVYAPQITDVPTTR
ncbi:hypothetical protein CO656_04415 [Sinorhizobium sp. FG01]|nr:hypothetical protein CO656_04415 [Sinorhizobium sp. FG01]PDT54799.1 hypothetical protein CO664_06785 [Sinorhizobium sp. NG07B]